MKKYQPVEADQSPWKNHKDPFHRSFYPLSWGKENSYVLFSPGIDRFILVENYDQWTLLETSRVLSSKISNIVYVLDQPTAAFDNTNCLYYSTKDKIKEKVYGGPTVMSHRQNSFMMKIRPESVIKTTWPEEFTSPERKAALIKLKDYAEFCLRVIHATTLSVNFRNAFPEKYYLETYFKDEYPDNFTIRADTTACDDGMETTIKNILYSADSIDEALEQIHNAWRKYSQVDMQGYRQAFYYILGLKQPADLENLSGIDKDRNTRTIWVV